MRVGRRFVRATDTIRPNQIQKTVVRQLVVVEEIPVTEEQRDECRGQGDRVARATAVAYEYGVYSTFSVYWSAISGGDEILSEMSHGT
jgi:hypothetical protein